MDYLRQQKRFPCTAQYRTYDVKHNTHLDQDVEVVAQRGNLYVIKAIETVKMPKGHVVGEFLLPGKTTLVSRLALNFLKGKP